MDEQWVMVLLYLVAFSATVQQCYSFSNDQLLKHDNFTFQMGSSIILKLSGNVYPKGYYSATINVGNPPRPYFLHISAGNDIFWIQCDAPCTKCLPAPHPLYKPSKDIMKCVDPFCALLLPSKACGSSQDQCVNELDTEYSSSQYVVVRDLFHLKLTNGNTVVPRLVFGCGFDQEVSDGLKPPFLDGVLGLGNRNTTILAQLRNLGLMPNIFSHCFSAEGGYLFMGDDILSSPGIVWAPMSSSDFYILGPAELQFDDQATGVEAAGVWFDSGSPYTYFGYPLYGDLLNMLNKTSNRNQLKIVYDNNTFPVCWKGKKAFTSIHDVKNLFKPLVLNFINSTNVQLQLPPEAYLIISDRGNVCLGILYGSGLTLISAIKIGDISMQGKMMIFDNEKQQIGWVPANCSELPKFS